MHWTPLLLFSCFQLIEDHSIQLEIRLGSKLYNFFHPSTLRRCRGGFPVEFDADLAFSDDLPEERDRYNLFQKLENLSKAGKIDEMNELMQRPSDTHVPSKPSQTPLAITPLDVFAGDNMRSIVPAQDVDSMLRRGKRYGVIKVLKDSYGFVRLEDDHGELYDARRADILFRFDQQLNILKSPPSRHRF